VDGRVVVPDPVDRRRDDVARAEVDHLLGPGAGQELDLDHGGDGGGQVREDGGHVRVRHRFHPLGLAGPGLSLPQGRDAPEPLVYLGREQLLLDSPPEHPLDPVDVLVDRLPGPARVYHRLADVFEGPGPERGRRGVVSQRRRTDRRA
jgi:hypothetical protein